MKCAGTRLSIKAVLSVAIYRILNEDCQPPKEFEPPPLCLIEESYMPFLKEKKHRSFEDDDEST